MSLHCPQPSTCTTIPCPGRVTAERTGSADRGHQLLGIPGGRQQEQNPQLNLPGWRRRDAWQDGQEAKQQSLTSPHCKGARDPQWPLLSPLCGESLGAGKWRQRLCWGRGSSCKKPAPGVEGLGTTPAPPAACWMG